MLGAAIAAAALATQAPAPAPSRPDFAAIDRAFVCPETLASDKARQDAIGAFMDAVAKAAPDMSIADMLLYRRELLENHGCVQTLQNLARSEANVRAGAVTDQAWWPVGDSPTVGLFVASDYLKTFVDPRFPEEHAVETYVRLQLATPRPAGAANPAYDQLISHAIYYCGTRRYALIENDYFLKGNRVRREPSHIAAQLGSISLYALTPTPKGSLNEVAAGFVCGVKRSGPA
jgi:hypothetical protein